MILTLSGYLQFLPGKSLKCILWSNSSTMNVKKLKTMVMFWNNFLFPLMTRSLSLYKLTSLVENNSFEHHDLDEHPVIDYHVQSLKEGSL